MPLSKKFLRFDRKGLSLVELMVVILIIGILAAVLGGAVVKWMAWQRDPTNPNSNVSLTINNIKQAVQRITQDIQQKARQEFQALAPNDKAYYQNLGNDLFERTKTSTASNKLISETEPTSRAIMVYMNTQLVKYFPLAVASINAGVPNYSNISFNTGSPLVTGVLTMTTPPANPRNYNNFFMQIPGLQPPMSASSIAQQLLVANSIKKNASGISAPSSNNRNSSACLLLALENHPKGIKAEDLGAGVVSQDTTGARFIFPGGVVVYHKLHYVDFNDYTADKSFKIGSLRVDIDYDTE
jgi:prepilin-type N-terminal cleavage/methylation domain-containing protein